MTITAQLADGRQLVFPDGTAPDVIQRTVKTQIASAKPGGQQGMTAQSAIDATPNFDPMSLPVGANPSVDKWTGGRDELGNKVYQTTDGTQYVMDQSSTGLMPGQAPGQSKFAAMSKDGLASGIGNAAAYVGSGLLNTVKSGIQAPGNPNATMGDALSTAMLVSPGAHPIPKAPAVADAATELGITPSLGMRGKPGAITAALLDKVPFTSGLVGQDAARAIGEVQAAAKAATAKIGNPVSAPSAGQALQGGLNAFVERFKTKAKTWYDAIPIQPDMKVQIPATINAAQEAKQAFVDNPALASKLGINSFDQVLAEAANNGMSWDAIKQFRSKIGEAVGSITGPLADQSQSALKGLYGTLSTDMEAAAKAAGPKAYSAWKAADARYKAGADRISTYLDGTISAKSPERAFEAFNAMAQADKSSADVTRMRMIKASLKPGEWGTIASSIIDRMGKAGAGVQGAAGDTFSPATFLTEWNKLSPEAKGMLVPDAVRPQLEKLAKVAERIKTGGLERNTSNTSMMTSTAALGASLYANPWATALGAGGLYLGAAALTSPRFLGLMNNLIAKPSRAALRPFEALAFSGGPLADSARAVLKVGAASNLNGAKQ